MLFSPFFQDLVRVGLTRGWVLCKMAGHSLFRSEGCVLVIYEQGSRECNRVSPQNLCLGCLGRGWMSKNLGVKDHGNWPRRFLRRGAVRLPIGSSHRLLHRAARHLLLSRVPALHSIYDDSTVWSYSVHGGQSSLLTELIEESQLLTSIIVNPTSSESDQRCQTQALAGTLMSYDVAW
jgi:hypothetical protein